MEFGLIDILPIVIYEIIVEPKINQLEQFGLFYLIVKKLRPQIFENSNNYKCLEIGSLIID